MEQVRVSVAGSSRGFGVRQAWIPLWLIGCVGSWGGLQLSSPVAYESPAAAACTDLLVKIWADALCETAYLADVAGLQYEVPSA